MVGTGAVANNIFRQVENMKTTDIHTQAFGYYELQGTGNVNQALPEPLVVSYLQISNNNSQYIKTWGFAHI